MELPETLFEEIAGKAIAPVYEAADERRKHPRVGFGSRARIFPLIENAGGCGCAVMVRDLSRGGVGFLFNHKLEIGDEFIIVIPRQEGPAVAIQCMTQRCEPGGTGGISFVVGASFELVLDESSSPLARPDVEGHTAGPTHWPGTVEEVARESLVTSVYKRVSSIALFDRSAARIRNRLKSNAAIIAEQSENGADQTEKMTKINESTKAAATAKPEGAEPAAAAELAVALPSYPIIEAPAPLDPSRPHKSLFAPEGAEASIDLTPAAVVATPVLPSHTVTTVSTHVEVTIETSVETSVEMAAEMPALVQAVEVVSQPVAAAVAAQPIVEPLPLGVTGAAAFAAIPVIAMPAIVKSATPVKSSVIVPVVIVAVSKSPIAQPSKPAAPAPSANESAAPLPWEMDVPAKKDDAVKGPIASPAPAAAAASNGESRDSLSVFLAPLTCRRVRRRR